MTRLKINTRKLNGKVNTIAHFNNLYSAIGHGGRTNTEDAITIKTK